MNAAPAASHAWHRFEIHQIEQFRNAVFGADLDAMQMAGPELGGSLAFSASNGLILSSGWIKGKVALRGVPSQDAITLLVNLRAGQGFLLWFNEIAAGDIAYILPGGSLNANLAPDTLYLSATVSPRRLAKEASDAGVLLDRKAILDRTCIQPRVVPRSSVRWMRSRLMRIHRGEPCSGDDSIKVGSALLQSIIRHLVEKADGLTGPVGHSGIILRAQDYVLQNLSSPLSIPAIASAVATSPRTLSRAFAEVLDITPHAYVRLLRLNRIRQDFASDLAATRTVSSVAQQWGIKEFGRLSGWYRDLFGENPSRTLAKSNAHIPSVTL